MSKEQRIEIYKIVAIILLVPIVCGLIFTNFSFAFNSIDDFSLSYSSSVPDYSVYSELFTYGLNGSNRYFPAYKLIDDDIPVYFFLLNNSSSYSLIFCIPSSEYDSLTTDPLIAYSYRSGANNAWVSWAKDSFTLSSDNSVFYILNRNTVTLNETYAPVFTSLSDGLNAVQYYIENGESDPIGDTYNSTFSLPAGNVAYVRVGDNCHMELTTQFPEYSNLLANPPWRSQTYISYGVSSLPSSDTKFPLSGMSLVNWYKQAQGKNLLGQTKFAGYPNDVNQSDNYIVIYNPTYRQVSSTGQGDISPTITCNFSEFYDVKIYPLTESLTILGDTESTSIDGYQSYYDGVATEDGDIVVSPSEPSMPSQPVIGGSGADTVIGSVSITDYLNQLQQTLSNFANNLINLIKAPISHIGQLINEGSNFMSALRGLYAWLPVDIQGIIISALTVVIAIGVFKVFL